VLLWTAGFDIVYACQDVDHDRREGLFSVPARLGIAGALRVARLCHALVPVALLAAAWFAGLGPVFVAGAAVTAALLAYEHWIVRADDLRRLNEAFFQVNVAIAFVMLLATAVDRVGVAP
jgi:4-hydroxybenzoate polyprenyltransferase